METKQLESTPGFVIYDVPEADNYVGPARLGAKLIPSNAVMLVRHQTYVFATLGMRRSGASVGLKSDPGDTRTAVEALATELAGDFENQRLLLSPGLRLDAEALAPILANDRRNPIASDGRNDISFGDELLGVGAAVAAAAALDSSDGEGLDGKKIAIEGFGKQGLAIAREAISQGATVVGVSNDSEYVSAELSLDALNEAVLRSESGLAGLAETAGASVGKPWQIWGNEQADVIFCGSKPGAMSGKGAELVAKGSAAVVAWSAAAISSKALAVLRQAGTVAVADFVSAVGPALSWWAEEGATHEQLRAQTAETVATVMSETAGHDDGYVMAACYRAEEFMSGWVQELPFGRPLG